jgi:hypothetical protein
VSKRSFRRLAAVTGAALAIGSMAPAIAAQVTTDNSADVAVTPNLSAVSLPGLTSLVPAGLVPTALVANIAGSLLGTPGLVLTDVSNIAGHGLAVPGAVLGTALGSTLTANAGVVAGLGGVGIGGGGLLSTPAGILGITGPLVGDALTTVGHVAAPAQMAAGSALGVVSTLPATVTSLPGTVLSLPGFITGSGLTGILGVTGNANVLAGLMGTL